MRRGRKRRIVGYGLAIACAVTLITIAVSCRWKFQIGVYKLHVSVARGAATVAVYQSPAHIINQVKGEWVAVEPGDRRPTWFFPRSKASAAGVVALNHINGFGVVAHIVSVLLWPWCLASGIGSAALLYSVRRIGRREGTCISCGYSLHGLAESDPCPECAAPRS